MTRLSQYNRLDAYLKLTDGELLYEHFGPPSEWLEDLQDLLIGLERWINRSIQ